MDADWQKVRILGHLPVVVSGRGPSELPEYFADRVRWRFASFDDAVADMAETYTIALAQFGAANPRARARPNMILMAGWSEERGRPECWVMDSGSEAAGPQQIMNICAPASPELMGCLRDMGLTGGMASFDPLGDGLRIMRAQRDLRFPHPVSGEMQPAVGGFCQHTVITAQGISTRIVERWPEAQAFKCDRRSR
ncbi:hypothetical protein [Methylorubrum extorquens]|uniref:hypothetical protein n=1 Tax=Methylorubrum extorquens TaxID=408 RepID=UPI001EE546DF|nr:hypothetical protein [Methylorubrum extorquens]MCG5245987.1 hypothetical protein [Methylorubrum extorquens]